LYYFYALLKYKLSPSPRVDLLESQSIRRLAEEQEEREEVPGCGARAERKKLPL